MHSEKITICMPVWERYDYFEMAVQSVLDQTMHCQLIVIDNASSHRKFEEFCLAKCIQYTRNSENIGVFGNWNRCAKAANTNYVLILGDDDELHPDFVKEFDSVATERDLDFYFTNTSIVWPDMETPWNCPSQFGAIDGWEIQCLALKKGLGIPSVSGVYKRELLLRQPFMENPSGSNDWMWLYSNFANMKIFGNEKALYKYRKHSNSDSSLRFNYIYYLNYPAIYLKIASGLTAVGRGGRVVQQMAVSRATGMLKEFVRVRGIDAISDLQSLSADDPYRNAIFDDLKYKSIWVWIVTTPYFSQSFMLWLKIRHFCRRIRSKICRLSFIFSCCELNGISN
jgi:glycosyltransferase involved in cell wall biosynthesis